MSPVAEGAPAVVLLDSRGRPCGECAKSTVHHAATPLHLGFSCYVVDPDGQILLTQRSFEKRTWPGIWTNACCGHPRPGETLREAVTRHLADELGLAPTRLRVALPDFVYRAEMADGTIEHELCPVVIARAGRRLQPDPAEVAEHEWVDWPALVHRAGTRPDSLSPWSVEQIRQMTRIDIDPHDWLQRGDGAGGILDRVPGRRTWSDVADAPSPASIARRVDAHLADFVEERSRDVAEAADAVAALHAAIASLSAAGGKRLRPAFLLWGNAVAGGDPAARSPLHAAAAVELLHTFALLHDDVMDRSVVRRGRPTAHRSLADDHGGHLADPGWFGVCAAILAGDLAHVWADAMFDRIDNEDVDRSSAQTARRLFTTLRTEVIAGQYLDLHIGCDPGADEADAGRIALLKSARYTATRPLQIGAALAGGTPELLDRLTEYGDATGVAFQLRDDVLGVFGDERVTGKSAADDLREGKRTLLVVRALRLADDAGRAVLTESLGRADIDDVQVARCRDVIAASGALASVEVAIDMHLERAVSAASVLDGPASAALTCLALDAARRDH